LLSQQKGETKTADKEFKGVVKLDVRDPVAD
jgi:hypothetical protein